MRYSLIYILIVLSFKSQCQSTIKVKIGSSYDFTYCPLVQTDHVSFNSYSVYGGIQLYNKLDLLIKFGYMEHQQKNSQPKFSPMMNFDNSIVVQYRFFKDFWVSPFIGFDIGYVMKSNLRNQYISDDFRISLNSSDDCYYCGQQTVFYDKFNHWGINFTPEAGVSFKMSNFYLNIGIGYFWTYYRATQNNNNSNSSIVNSLYGIQLSGGLSYRFGGNKKVVEE